MSAITLTRSDRATALQWAEFALEDSLHRGGATILLPQEESLLRLLREDAADACDLSLDQASLLQEWMRAAVRRPYGPAEFVTHAEDRLYHRVMAALGEAPEVPTAPDSGFRTMESTSPDTETALCDSAVGAVREPPLQHPWKGDPAAPSPLRPRVPLLRAVLDHVITAVLIAAIVTAVTASWIILDSVAAR